VVDEAERVLVTGDADTRELENCRRALDRL